MIRCARPRLVTFDVTGTLLMTKVEDHYMEIAAQYGLSLDPAKLAGSFKSNYHKLALEHPIYGKHTGLGWENWWRRIIYNVFRDQNQHNCEETLHRVASSLIQCYGTDRCWRKYTGAIDLLEYLKKKGVDLGVISNFDERLEAVLLGTRLRRYFSFVLSSYTLGVEKPRPEIFEEALKRTAECTGRTVLPRESVHVGDRVDNDYLGAKNARWNAILVKHDDEPVDERVSSDDVVKSLPELQSHFDTIFHGEAGRA